MTTFNGVRRPGYHRLLQLFLLVLTIATVSDVYTAQSSRERVEGVKNFGRVTDRYFRGGQVTEVGVKRLAEMGVRTIIDLRDKPSVGEPEACEQNGIKYFKFPMNGHDTPDEKTVNKILSMIQEADGGIYVHCSAGKHRAGTIAALYRMRVQGWSKERAWAEQKSYGFGPPEEHAQLYAFAYGSAPRFVNTSALASSDEDDDEEKPSKSKKEDKSKSDKDDDDDDDSEDEDDDSDDSDDDDGDDDDDSEDEDDGDDDDDSEDEEKSDSDKGKEKKVSDTEKAVVSEKVETAMASTAVARASSGPAGRLSPDASYISMAEALTRAKSEGATGSLLKVDLEWDEVRSLTTWDFTFSSGKEYVIDASTGKLLDAKPKPAGKLAVLSPLEIDGSAKKVLTFQEIIKRAEKTQSQPVLEMELKRIKGRSQTVFEVALADGATLYYDAVTGEAISDL